MQFREVPSLSRLLDTSLTVDVVPGEVDTIDHLQTITVSIPSDEFAKMTGDEVETLYLRPMVRSLGEKINTLGSVRAGVIPLSRFPKSEIVFQCKNGKIPVLLRIVRRTVPTDRHQILIHALVQPETEDGT